MHDCGASRQRKLARSPARPAAFRQCGRKSRLRLGELEVALSAEKWGAVFVRLRAALASEVMSFPTNCFLLQQSSKKWLLLGLRGGRPAGDVGANERELERQSPVETV